MIRRLWHSPWLAYLLTGLISLVLVAVLWRPWLGSLQVPLMYTGDYTFSLAVVKGIIQNGWVMQNPFVGAPFGGTMFDYPVPETLLFLMIKGLALFSSDPVVVLNLFYLLGFPLAALSGLYGLRGLGLRTSLAIPGALAFGFLPYHFLRLEHVFLAAYFMLPPVILLAVEGMEGRLAFVDWDVRARRFRLDWKNRRAWGAVLVCVLAGSTGLYYALFLAFVMGVALVKCLLEETRPLRFSGSLTALALAGVLAATLGANLLPFYLAQRGQPFASELIVRRQASDTEHYGLKLIQLLLPRPGHQIGALGKINIWYQNVFNDVNESTSSSLGLIGSLGCLASLAVLFKDSSRPKNPLKSLGLLNLSCFLLGTIGGIATIVAFFVAPLIRSVNRISVLIGFISIAVSLFLLSELIDFLATRLRVKDPRLTAAGWILLGLVLLGVVYVDQCGKPASPDTFRETQAAYQNDLGFVQKIEARAAQGAMIFQLPYVSFPEAGRGGTLDYENFKLYLASTNLRWSFGGMRGRLAGDWYRDAATQPVAEMVESLAAAGFAGISVQRSGYFNSKEMADLEKDLTGQLGTPAVESSDRDLLYYDLSAFVAQEKARFSPQEWEARVHATLYPAYRLVSVGDDGRMYPPEENLVGWFQYSDRESGLTLWNLTETEQSIHLQFDISSANKAPANFSIAGSDWNKTYPIDGKPRTLEHDLVIPAGQKVILAFHYDGEYYRPTNGDPRAIAFEFRNMKYRLVQ